jgi:ABC-type antimicrobial peptide transport system permease subunit
MARGAGRQREIQLRFDLGARKLRVFRQLLTENLLLGLLGSIAALPLSYAFYASYWCIPMPRRG